MAQAPPLTVPPLRAVSGSYRIRHPYASASQPVGGQETGHGADRFTCSLTKADEPACQSYARVTRMNSTPVLRTHTNSTWDTAEVAD